MAVPSPNEAWTRRKQAAGKYRPKRLRLLMIADAPPSDDRYFYFEDAADALFDEVARVLFETESPESKAPYLNELRRRGVFVMELKPDAPRNGEPLGPNVAPQLLNVETLAPEKIVLIGGDVYDAMYDKMKKGGLPVVDVRVPASDDQHQVEFRQKFRQALVRGELEKLIKPLTKKALEKG